MNFLKSIWASIKKIFNIIKWVKGLFGGSTKPPITAGPVVVKVEIEGRFKVIYWSDGRVERVEYNENDPTDVGAFLNNIRK